MSTKYFVSIEKYAEKHFIKSFSKKYGRAWNITLDALLRELQSFDILLMTSIAEIVSSTGNVDICKVEFKVAGTTQSRHGSGNRCIVARHRNLAQIRILLVYHKNDLAHGAETTQWKNIIHGNYPEYQI